MAAKRPSEYCSFLPDEALDVTPLEKALSDLADELLQRQDALRRFDMSFSAECIRLQRQLEDNAEMLDIVTSWDRPVKDGQRVLLPNE